MASSDCGPSAVKMALASCQLSHRPPFTEMSPGPDLVRRLACRNVWRGALPDPPCPLPQFGWSVHRDMPSGLAECLTALAKGVSLNREGSASMSAAVQFGEFEVHENFSGHSGFLTMCLVLFKYVPPFLQSALTDRSSFLSACLPMLFGWAMLFDVTRR